MGILGYFNFYPQFIFDKGQEDTKLKKFLLSLLVGVIIGGIICCVFMDYETSNYVIQDFNGQEEKEIKEWDFMYITQAGFIILAITLLFYFSWGVMAKRMDKDQKM